MKIKIILIMLIILFFSCSISKKGEVKKKLYEKYGEKFHVYNLKYVFVLNKYQFDASPVKNKNLIFGGSYQPGMKNFSDGYIQYYLNEEYAKIIKRKIEKYTQPVFVFTRLTFDDELYDYKKIDVKTLDLNDFFTKSTYINCYIICYFFKVLTAKTKNELLTGVYEVIKPYKKHIDASVTLKIFFWDPKFFDNYSLDVFEYDKLSTNSPEAENFDLQEKYIIQELTLYMMTDKPYKDFNIDTIYNNVVRVKNGKSNGGILDLNRLAEEEK